MNLSRRQFVAFSLFAGSLALPLTACSKTAQLNNAQSEYNPNYVIATIENTDKIGLSLIAYFDIDLNLVNSIKYPYNNLGFGLNGSCALPINGDEIYLVPNGLMFQSYVLKVLSLNLQTGAVREYHVDQPSIVGIAVDDQYFYTVNTDKGTGHLGRIDKSTGEATYIDIGSGANSIIGLDNGFCVYWYDIYQNSYLSTYTRDLQLIKSFNLTAQGIDTVFGPTAQDNGRFCFINENNQPHYYSIYSFDTNSFELKKICDVNYAVTSIATQGNILYATGYGDANYVEFYDVSSGELLNSQKVSYDTGRGIFYDGFLFICDGWSLVKYIVDGTNITEVANVAITNSYVDTGTCPAHDIFVRP